MLVSEVIDRAYSEFLYPAGVNQPAYDVLNANLSEGGGTITVRGRVPNIPDDSLLEIDSELILNDDTVGTSLTVKERGYLETNAAQHLSGDKVWINPTYTRKSVFNGVKTVVGGLYPQGLYVRATDTTPTFTNLSTKALPTGGKRVLSVLTQDRRGLYRPPLREGYDYEVFYQFDPPKYQLRRGAAEGDAMVVSYLKDFTLPTAETDDLSTLGVPSNLQAYIPMAVAGYLLQGKELPRVQIQEIRRFLAAQGVQVGAALNVGQALIQTFERRYVALERRRLDELNLPSIEFVRTS